MRSTRTECYMGVFMSNRELELQALITEREGMIAENKQREILGDSVAYSYSQFAYIADCIRALKEE